MTIPVPGANQPNTQRVFSEGATQQLAIAIEHHLVASPRDPHDGLVAAIQRLRAEAQAGSFGAEQVVLAVKAVWLSNPGRRHYDPYRKSLDYYHLLDECLSIYFVER